MCSQDARESGDGLRPFEPGQKYFRRGTSKTNFERKFPRRSVRTLLDIDKGERRLSRKRRQDTYITTSITVDSMEDSSEPPVFSVLFWISETHTTPVVKSHPFSRRP